MTTQGDSVECAEYRDSLAPQLRRGSGRVGYELDTPQLSACPFSGFSYERVSEDDVSISALTIPVGFGVGKTLPAGEGYAFTLSGAPQLLYVR